MQKKKTLDTKAFNKARDFLMSEARPLELARFECIFCDSNISAVIRELSKFQNDDGGFGHGLEADLRAPESSALCTSVAFQVIREHQISGSHKIVRQGIHYFMETLDRNEAHWRIIPHSAECSPHAPWWKQEGREKEYKSFSLNPTAEILGYLLDYGGAEIRGERIIAEITNRVLDTLSSLNSIEMHDLLCCLRLWDTENLPSSLRECLQSELGRLLPKAVTTKPEHWKEYGLRPLLVVRSPDSPFINGLEEAISLNLDFEVDEQNCNGSWSPTWFWGGNYPEAWDCAKREWSGVLTLDKLLTFARFGRIQ